MTGGDSAAQARGRSRLLTAAEEDDFPDARARPSQRGIARRVAEENGLPFIDTQELFDPVPRAGSPAMTCSTISVTRPSTARP